MTREDWRPLGATAVAREMASPAAPGIDFTATCSQVTYGFMEGSWATFGRDDEQCAIPVWECILSSELSRVAGVLWCVDGDLWVRNVSTSHELLVHAGAMPTHLPPRRGRRGPACSLGAGGIISGPSTGSWHIKVRCLKVIPEDSSAREVSTVTLPRPPDALLTTAVAMCAPLLQRAGRPATYAEIGEFTGAKPRTARDRVDRLLAFYQSEGVDRLWRAIGEDDSHYAPLARLLVYRAIVTQDDLELLVPLASERARATHA